MCLCKNLWKHLVYFPNPKSIQSSRNRKKEVKNKQQRKRRRKPGWRALAWLQRSWGCCVSASCEAERRWFLLMSDFNVFFHVLFIRAETVCARFISLCVIWSDFSTKSKFGIFRIYTRGFCLLVSSGLHVYLCNLCLSGSGKFQMCAGNALFELPLQEHHLCARISPCPGLN